MERIVVGVDGSDGARAALDWAADEARRRGAELQVALAWEAMTPDLPDLGPVPGREEGAGRAEAALASIVDDLPDDVTLTTRVEEGGAAALLVDAASGADLLVVGAHGGGSFLPGVGSTATRVALRSPVPTVVVPRDGVASPEGPVVVGVDGSVAGARALDEALRWTAPDGPVVAVHAWHIPVSPGLVPDAVPPGVFEDAGRSALDGALDGLEPADRARVEGRLIHGEPRSVLADQAEGARLVVVGARGHNPLLHRLLGSSVTYLLHRHPTAVLVVPDPDEG